MSSMVSKWPVLVSLAVTAADADDDSGRLTSAAGERLFAAARDEYLAGCATLAGRTLEAKNVTIVAGDAPVEAGEVTVSVSVIELFPDRLTMALRVRSTGADGIVGEGTCDVLLGGPLTDEIRDELIAHAHGARHYH